MSTLKEDLTTIKEIQDGLVNNKVARFSYTQSAYDTNTVNGVNEYNVNNEQNIPNGTASIMKVNSTVLDKGYRAQASSITRMLMNHFLGRISYNLNKINDNMQSLLDTLITKFPTSLPANGGRADTADTANTANTADTANKVANSLTFGSKTYDGSSSQTITASDVGAKLYNHYLILSTPNEVAKALFISTRSTVYNYADFVKYLESLPSRSLTCTGSCRYKSSLVPVSGIQIVSNKLHLSYWDLNLQPVLGELIEPNRIQFSQPQALN